MFTVRWVSLAGSSINEDVDEDTLQFSESMKAVKIVNRANKILVLVNKPFRMDKNLDGCYNMVRAL